MVLNVWYLFEKYYNINIISVLKLKILDNEFVFKYIFYYLISFVIWFGVYFLYDWLKFIYGYLFEIKKL